MYIRHCEYRIQETMISIQASYLGPFRKGGLFKVCAGFGVSFAFRLRFPIKISDFRKSVFVDQMPMLHRHIV